MRLLLPPVALVLACAHASIARGTEPRGASPEAGPGPGRMYGGAQDVHREPDPSPRELERLRSIQSLFEEEEDGARLWWFGWMGGFAAVSIADAVLAAALHDDALVAQARVRAITAGIGAISTLVVGFPAALAASKLRGLPESNAGEARAKLETAEHLLADAARIEAFGRSWMPHAGALFVNAVAALFLWRHDNLPVNAAVNFSIGMTVAEIKIWTQPTSASDAIDLALIPVPPSGVALRASF